MIAAFWLIELIEYVKAQVLDYPVFTAIVLVGGLLYALVWQHGWPRIGGRGE